MSRTRSVREWIDAISAELSDVVERPRREAELLIMVHLQCDQLWLITHQDEMVNDSDRLEKWYLRRKNHEPLEYITNKVSFYSEEFHIEPGALIPRPETELLIDKVLEEADPDKELTIVEVGVGSGAVSVILAKHLPNARIIAVDISEDALKVAKKNIEEFDLSDRIELRQSDLLDNVQEKIDLLVSNPPYIAKDAVLEPNLDFEPHQALYGGLIGDEIIQKLLAQVYERDLPFFACEMGYDQKEKIEACFNHHEHYMLTFYKDLAGFDRGFTLKRRNNE